MNIAVIPARGGSKRIPRKNIREFCGRPMIAWSIEATKASGLFDHIVVSTDDAEIAVVAKRYDALEMFFQEHFPARSQDLPKVLHDAGQFYWGRPKAWTEGKRIFNHQSTPIIIPRRRVQDINNPEDWVRGEFIFRQLEEKV